jgi:hypothetical protein
MERNGVTEDGFEYIHVFRIFFMFVEKFVESLGVRGEKFTVAYPAKEFVFAVFPYEFFFLSQGESVGTSGVSG